MEGSVKLRTRAKTTGARDERTPGLIILCPVPHPFLILCIFNLSAGVDNVPLLATIVI